MSKTQNGGKRAEGRRDFLKGMLVGGSGAVLALAGGGAQAAPPAPVEAVAPPAGSAGYRETDHVRAYYETAGL
jgi:hypothetical protein